MPESTSTFRNTALHVTNAVGWALVITTLALVGFWVPPSDAKIGESYLIFFFHFPSAVNCLNFFVFAGVLGVVHLVLWAMSGHGRLRTDFAAAAAVEVGVLACTITLVTGSIWAKAAWGVWWNFKDPRLMSVAIMWFAYVGYLALRSAIDDPYKRAAFCAIFAVLAMINVPMVLFSIKLLGQQSHPPPISMGETSMTATRWLGAVAFLVVYAALWGIRYRVIRSRHELRTLEEAFYVKVRS